MPVEIEAKMKVADLAAVVDRLREVGAQSAGQFFELNIFFDTEDRSLLAADKGLRLRTSRNTVTDEVEHVITFKGPRQQGMFKQREECESIVTSGRDAEQLLLALEYTKVLAFEKRRSKWTIDGCTIELDELPHLGAYVEIEGPDDGTISQVREKLGLGRTVIVRSSYAAMLMNHLQETGSHEKTVTFPA